MEAITKNQAPVGPQLMPQLYAATLSYGHPEWTFYVGAILAGVVLLATLRLPSLDEIPPAPKKGEGRVINAEGSAGSSGAAAGGNGGGDGGGGELRVRREGRGARRGAAVLVRRPLLRFLPRRRYRRGDGVPLHAVEATRRRGDGVPVTSTPPPRRRGAGDAKTPSTRRYITQAQGPTDQGQRRVRVG